VSGDAVHVPDPRRDQVHHVILHLVADGLDDDVVLAGDDVSVGDSLVVADGRQSPSDFPRRSLS